MVSLLGLGDNTVDTYVDRGRQFPGGNAVNVAVLARRLGARTSYIGCLGNDAAGDLVHAALLAEGVDVGRCRRAVGANARALIGHVNGDRRFLSASPGTRSEFTLEAEDFRLIALNEVTHTGANSDLDPALAAIKAAARLLSYDLSEKWRDGRLERVAPHVDVLFLSDPTQSANASGELAIRAATLGPSIVVVTRGAAEAVAAIGGAVYRQPSRTVRVVDTLGAGDGFIAAFLVSWLSEASPGAALAAGVGFAAEVCSYEGAFGRGVAWAAPEGVSIAR